MFAIINIAGKQFRVEEGDELKVPHLDTAEGETLKFDQVLPVSYTHLTLPTILLV